MRTPESPRPSKRASLASKRLALVDGPTSAALVEAFDGILTYAEHQTLLPAADAEHAIHEFRKSVRRARAVVKLLRNSMPNASYRALNGALRNAVASTSMLRDLDVLQDQVSALPDQARLTPIKAALHRHLLARQSVGLASHTCDVLIEGRGLLKPLPAQLRQGLPANLQFQDLQDALATSFRRTRKAMRAAERERPRAFVALHNFRKRVKELRYQLELLAPRCNTGKPLTKLRRLARDLGEIMDLVVLRDYVQSHAGELAVDPKPLLRRLKRLAGARRDKLLRGAAAFFASKPKAFAALHPETK